MPNYLKEYCKSPSLWAIQSTGEIIVGHECPVHVSEASLAPSSAPILFTLFFSEPMQVPPENRFPVEVWERILLSVISVDNSLVLATTCSTAEYLSFKRTCSDSQNESYRHFYKLAERNRRNLRLVCRTWGRFVDRWDHRGRWIRTDRLSGRRDEDKWRGVVRWDYTGPGNLGKSAAADWDGIEEPNYFAQWRYLASITGPQIRLQRVELLHIEPEFFIGMMEALWGAATALVHLRSLALLVCSEGYPIMKRVSKHFPDLTHLTLEMHQRASWDEVVYPELGIHGLKQLETLMIFPSNAIFHLSQWALPSLRHVHVRPIHAFSHQVYEFLERHATTVETIDLDDGEVPTISSAYAYQKPETKTLLLPFDFWDTFVRLKLLRCSWKKTTFTTLPTQHHALECFVLTDSVEQVEQLAELLGAWVAGDGVKVLKEVVLYGSYLTKGHHMLEQRQARYALEKGVVQDLVRRLEGNGTRLISPAGKSWTEPR